MPKNYAGNSSDFSEVDFSLGYTLPFNLEDVSFDVGAIDYVYPGIDQDSQLEVYGRAALLTWQKYFIPSVKAFAGVSDADGMYVLFDLLVPYEISDAFSIAGGLSAGWGSTSYNDQQWGGEEAQDEGFNDYNVYFNASYDILENLALQANATYTFVDGGSIEDGANANYEDDHKVWGSLNLVYSF